jgi:membrane fusion protein (multidrug efflux system)
LQNGYQLRVLTADNRVTTRTVSLGRRVGSRWIVESGLKPGEQVIVEGPAIKDGALVAPHPFVAPPGTE